jgi:hypothetical protein
VATSKNDNVVSRTIVMLHGDQTGEELLHEALRWPNFRSSRGQGAGLPRVA